MEPSGTRDSGDQFELPTAQDSGVASYSSCYCRGHTAVKTRVFMNAVVIIICADERAMLGVNLRLDKERHLHTDTLNNQHETSFSFRRFPPVLT